MIDLAALDLTDIDLYRCGFPHEIFTGLRRQAPVWWQVVPETLAGCADEGDRPQVGQAPRPSRRR